MSQDTEMAFRLPPSILTDCARERQSGRRKPLATDAANGNSVQAVSTLPLNERGRPMRILVVDDEQLIADTLVRILNLHGFAATATYSGDAALDLLPRLCPDIVLTDVRMPGRDGIETGVLIREQCPEARIVLFSGQAGIGGLGDEARGQGHGFELWPKPIHPRELVRRLRDL